MLGVCLLVSFLQSGFFALALVPDPEDTVHMFLGRLALSGDISLYQDDCRDTAHRFRTTSSACRNFSVTVRRDLRRAKYLSLASTSVQGESGVLVFNSISSEAVM